MVGDSLSAGYGIDIGTAWPQLLQERLASLSYPERVVNASISGETTGGGLRRLPELLEAHRPSLVVVELGANDGLRGVPLPEIERNLRHMLALIESRGAAAIVIKMQMPPNYGRTYAAGFEQIYERLAQGSSEVALAPFLLADVVLDPALMQADGLHPTAAAQPRLLATLWPTLQAVLDGKDPHAAP